MSTLNLSLDEIQQMKQCALTPLFVDRETLPSIVALAMSTIEEEIRQGRFPKPRQLSARRVGWLVRELQEWAEARPPSDLPCPPNTGKKKGRVGPEGRQGGEAPREE